MSPLCGVGAVVSVVPGDADTVFLIAHWVQRFGTVAFGHIPLVLSDPLVAIEYLNDLIPPLWLFFSPVSFLGWDGVCGWLCSSYLLFWCAFAFELLWLFLGVRG